jgi:hypothetical protein
LPKFFPASLRVITTTRSFCGSMRSVAEEAAPWPKVPSPRPSSGNQVVPMPYWLVAPVASLSSLMGSSCWKVASLKKRLSP